MRTVLSLVVLCLPCWLSMTVIHPFHVSNTEFNYNATDKNLEVSCRIFTDDFEKALGMYFKEKADFTDKKLSGKMEIMVRDYMKTHLAIKIDNKRLALSCLGFELDHEAVNVYLEHPLALPPKKIEVQNTLVYEAYEDQVSVVHFIVNGQRKSSKLDYPDKVLHFTF